MKLLFLMTEPFGIGGVQSNLLTLIKDLSFKGHKAYVATTPGLLLDELRDAGGSFQDINFLFRGPRSFFNAVFKLRSLIKENDINIVAPQSVRSAIVCFFALRFIPFSYKAVSSGKSVPIITTIYNIHNPAHFRYGGHILERCSDYVIFESHYERNRLLSSGLSNEKSEVIYTGIDTDYFKPILPDRNILDQYGLDKAEQIIYGIVARISEEKGHSLLIKAFQKVNAKNSKTRLLIVGDGPLREEVHDLVKELNLEDAVVFTGVRRDIPAISSILDVFVLSSTRESFPLASREAMAAGLPIIAPHIGGCPEIVEDGVTGLLFEKGNVDMLSHCMLKIAESGRCKEMGKAARDRAVRLFRKENWVTGKEVVYKRYV